MTYPHRYYPATETTAEGPCDCGAIRPARGDCPASMRAHIAELERHVGSLHKAAAAGRDAERAAVVAYLRGQAESMRSSARAMAFALGNAADAIERGEHRDGA